MNKGEILVAIHNMRGEYAHKMNETLMKVGKNTIEGSLLAPLFAPNLERDYRDAKAKVSVLDELLEKIDNTPEDTGDTKHNPFCNDVIRDAQGNEIARAKGANT
jgi:CRISPR/Cas system CSM-associated protein Csm2 small subunit